MEENKKSKIELKNIVVYSNEHCPYCKTIKTEFENQEIEFENRDTIEFKDEWDEVVKLTGIPSVPTIMYEGEYFVPGRDFNHPMGLIQNLSNYKTSSFDTQRRILEKITSLNFNFAQAINHLSNKLVSVDSKLLELQAQLNKDSELNSEENVDQSTN